MPLCARKRRINDFVVIREKGGTPLTQHASTTTEDAGSITK